MAKCNAYIKCNEQGYTLIEVLAALFIFVIIVSMVSYTFTQLLKTTETIKSKEERLLDIQMAITTLQFDLSQVIDKPIILNNGEEQGSFYTRNNTLHFYKTGNINPEDRFPRSSIEEIEYILVDGNFIKRIKDDNNPTQNEILLRDVTSLSWQFIDKRFASYTLWPPTQDWEYTKPNAVIFTLTLPDMGNIEKMVEL